MLLDCTDGCWKVLPATHNRVFQANALKFLSLFFKQISGLITLISHKSTAGLSKIWDLKLELEYRQIF